MTTETITRGSGNVFADLGFPDRETVRGEEGQSIAKARLEPFAPRAVLRDGLSALRQAQGFNASSGRTDVGQIKRIMR